MKYQKQRLSGGRGIGGAYLLLLVVQVVDKEDAVPCAVISCELLKGHAHINPPVRLPASPPLQASSFNPDRL